MVSDDFDRSDGEALAGSWLHGDVHVGLVVSYPSRHVDHGLQGVEGGGRLPQPQLDQLELKQLLAESFSSKGVTYGGTEVKKVWSPTDSVYVTLYVVFRAEFASILLQII